MKILFALQCANAGGTERVALGFIKQFTALGHECRVVSLEPIAGMGPLLEHAGIDAEWLDYRKVYGIPAYMGLRRLFTDFKPDALIQFGHRIVTSAAAVGARVPAKSYFILHHHEGMKSDLAWRLSYRLAALAYPRMLFLTDHTRQEAVRLLPSIEPRSAVLYPPIPLQERTTPEMKAAARARLGLPADVWLMGSAGRHVPVKRFDVFLQTAVEVARLNPESRFVVGGHGPESERLHSLADELGLGGRVIWLEWMTDMDDFYRSLDVICFNTDADALGLLPLEALARGIPVVSSVCRGGLSEILPWQGAYVFDKHDPERLAEVAVGLVGAEAEKQIRDGRKYVAEHCTPEQVGARMMESFLSQLEP